MPIRSPLDPVLVAACRTPVGTAGHAFAGLTVAELAAPVLAEAARRAAPLGLPVMDVVLGNCLGPGGNVGRIAALAAGLGTGIPGVTVDRQCGSGLEAVRLAAALVREAAARNDGGPAPLVLAGGAESASTAPWRFWPPARGETQPGDEGPADAGSAGVPRTGARPADTAPAAARSAGTGPQPAWARQADDRSADARHGSPLRYERAPFAPAGFPDPDMGPAADRLARERGLSRQRQDDYAARSHRRALAAMETPEYAELVVPVNGVRTDQRPRAMTAERLGALRPAFGGSAGAARTVTAGNASGISDGAAVLALTTAAAAEAARLPAVRILAGAVTAGDTALPGAGAGSAARVALARAGVTATALDVIEVVEAFAAVALAFADDLGIEEHRLCPDGGAIAIGHPWGASGAIALAGTVQRLLRGEPGSLGLAACAIGGGQGIAMVVERCDEATP